MGILKADEYYLKAYNCYPYDIEEVVENLNYALGYDAEHVGANYLMGRIYMEQFKDLSKAEEYYVTALSNNANHIEASHSYSMLLISKKDFAKARKVLSFTTKIKGADLGSVYRTLAYCYEAEKKYKKALNCIKKAKTNTYNEHFMNVLDEDKKRIKNKHKGKKKQK